MSCELAFALAMGAAGGSLAVAAITVRFVRASNRWRRQLAAMGASAYYGAQYGRLRHAEQDLQRCAGQLLAELGRAPDARLRETDPTVHELQRALRRVRELQDP